MPSRQSPTVSHVRMTNNHTTFYPVHRTFQTGALSVTGTVTIAGWPQMVPLWICAEWDSRTVLVGYHWSAGNGLYRAQNGLEEWFLPRPFLARFYGEREEREHVHRYDKDQILVEDHEAILKVTRFVQLILDEADDRRGLSEEMRHIVRRIFNTGELIVPVGGPGTAQIRTESWAVEPRGFRAAT